jgi:hypothetical protein
MDGESPDEILRSFPMSSPAVNIYGAITFYLKTRKRAELAQRHAQSPSALAKRLREAKEHAAAGRH